MSASHWPPRCPDAGTGRIPGAGESAAALIRHRMMTPVPAHDLSARRHAEGQTPQRTRPPRIHPTRGTLACRSAGADAATPIPGDRRQPPHTATVRGGCPQGAIAAEGAPDGDVCATVPWLFGGPRPASPTPACASSTGPRWSSASGCAWTAPISAPPPSGVVSRQTGVRRGRHQAAAGGLRGHLQELRRRVREALPATRIRPLGTCPASSKAHAQDEVDYAGCITTHLRRWGAARATLVRIR